MLNDKEVAEALEARRSDAYILDHFSGQRKNYSEWQADVRTIYRIYANEFDVVWPDGKVTQGLPKIANFLALAADDRAREVVAVSPSIICRPDRLKDTDKAKAELRERIIRGYWTTNDLPAKIAQLAYDQMLAGVSSVLVLPDTAKPIGERYPVYKVLEPLRSYPDPIFAKGPWVDSFIYSYEENIRTVEARFGVTFNDWKKDSRIASDKLTMIEFYDPTDVVIVAQVKVKHSKGDTRSETIQAFKHGLGRCPVVVNARASGDGLYRSEFLGGLGVTNTLNRLTSMMLDDAFNKTYGLTASYDVENPEESGPGAHLIYSSERGKFEWITPPNQPFTNIQVMRDLTGAVRASNIIPPSRSGDPNESIISAAGIGATQGQFIGDVRDLQRMCISPLLQAANEVALKVDEVWCDASKPVGHFPGSMAETYKPSRDIAGNYRNEVTYGQTAGLDPINTNVMALQQLGAGAISRATFMEQSVFVEDPTREEKRMLKEALLEAQKVGLITEAQSGRLNSAQLAEIDELLNEDGVSLSQAIRQVTAVAPLAAPAAGPAGGAPPQAPGLAGAAEGQQPMMPQMPPLAELMAG